MESKRNHIDNYSHYPKPYYVNFVCLGSSRYQKIIQLRFFEEKSIKEISEELNITVANTKVCIMRAKKILVELLKDYDLNND